MKLPNIKLIGVCLFMLMLAFTAWRAASEKKRADTAEHNLALATATISDMQTRQRDVAALDAKYTGELADARATIENLQLDVAAGRKRLRVNATCPAVQSATGSASLDDATGPGLADSAERDYFTLRERIETSGKQIAGLQAYILRQCLDKDK